VASLQAEWGIRVEIPKFSIVRTSAEFAVIVVGVLVALGVESWREDVADRALELEYLERLKNDFHNDSLRIAGAIETTAIQQSHITRALHVLEEGGNNSDGELLSVFMASRSIYSREIGATFQELFGTGQLRLVRNAELRIRLVDFYSWLSVAIVAAPGLRDRIPYRDIVRGEIDPGLQEAIRACGGEQSRILALPDTNMVLDCDYGASDDEVAVILDRIRSNPGTLPALRRWAAAFTALISRLDQVEDRIVEMELLLSNEIARH
jgi:hypothetical protein